MGQGVVQEETVLAPRAETRAGGTPSRPALRPQVRGPFLFLGDAKLTVKAVTYGTFAADAAGDLFPPHDVVRADFRAIREAGANAIRTYTPPPDWVMEEAREAGLRVLAGIYWEGRNCDFDDRRTYRAAEQAVREAVRRLRAFPDVVLAYAIGNEIPPLVARFHGRRTIEGFLERLYRAAKAEDREGLVTYGNYPTTEFLQLDFLDLYTLNVYLLDPAKLSAYLDRMMIETKGKPLILGEVGEHSGPASSGPQGEARQASVLEWTIPMALDKGAAGVCVFAWTDDWVVGGKRVEDWPFGLVTTDRRPKAALSAVRRRFTESAFARRRRPWPRVSVVVCNYNGGDTLDETLTSLERLDYPDYEIVLVEDGSTDASREIARRHADRVRILEQENRGLGVARNVGAEAATGSIVAYIDSDAFADPDWLRHLVLAMEEGETAGAGGPNLTPASDGLTAQFIATCPGNPTHVLKDNRRAEHIAGVNMAFRRDVLLGLGGFDPVHRRAGDDVDIGWRFEDAGYALAFAPAAIVWHHRRPSVRRYLKQQSGYGEAENQLELKHPERFNLAGHIRWAGRVYLAPRSASVFFRPFIYHGRLGTALFQTLYQKDPSYLMDGPRTIQWYLLWMTLLLLTPLSLWFLPVSGVLLSLSVWTAFLAGLTTEVAVPLTRGQSFRKIAVVAWLHFLHPVVRFYGRLRARLSHADPLRWAMRLRWLRPDRVVRESYEAVRRRKEVRRWWGLGASHREPLLREVQQELKGRRLSARLGQEWDNHDLVLTSAVANVGRLFTASEHYDQALCVGYLVRSTRLARFVLLGLALGAAYLAVRTPIAPWLSALVPAFALYYDLAQRARLRGRVWESVEAAAARLGGKPFRP